MHAATEQFSIWLGAGRARRPGKTSRNEPTQE
jgi:hypothetical protein